MVIRIVLREKEEFMVGVSPHRRIQLNDKGIQLQSRHELYQTEGIGDT